MLIFQALLGLAAFSVVPLILSENRSLAGYKKLIVGIAIQFALALAFLKLSFLREAFFKINDVIMLIEKAATKGGSFMFGYLGGGTLPFAEIVPGKTYIVAFRVMPVVMLVSATSAVLYHWGVVQYLVKIFSKALQKTMKISAVQGLSVSSSVFLGIVETPMFMRPYVQKMSRGTLFTMMTAAMATVAGTVMVLYAGILKNVVSNAMAHIMIASVISAPAAIVISHIWIPSEDETVSEDEYIPEKYSNSTFGALIKGTTDGIQLAITIVGMIIVLFSLISLGNLFLVLLPIGGKEPLTIEYIIGIPFRPVVWLMGIPWHETALAGQLMGIKTVLNEFVSYQKLAQLAPGSLSEHTRLVLTYAMCGFANLGSLALLTGSLSVMAPERQNEIAELGLKSIVSGTLATCMTGTVISIVSSL